MSTTEQLMTADELLRMPDDGFRYELVKGELRKTAPAGHEHGRVAINFTWPLAQYVETKAMDWLAAGARMVLALNSRKRTVTVFRSLNEIVILGDDAILDLDDVVPGFKIAVKDIFD